MALVAAGDYTREDADGARAPLFADHDTMRFDEGMTMPKTRSIALAVPIILALTSCGGSDDGAGSSDATTDDAGSDSLTVTWDGTDCVYEGPAEVRAGAVAVD